MTTRHTVHDIIEPTTDAELAHAKANLAAYRAERGADATTTEDPGAKRHLGVEEHEASARALAEANQNPAAIQAWHRAAIGHARAGNAAGVIAAITHAEHLANNRDFAPDLERKSTATDASAVTGPIERVGDASDGPIEPPIERVGDRPAPDANKPASNTAAAERL